MPTETDGASNAPAEEQTPQPKYVSEDAIGNIVNSAVTAHLKRANIPALIAESIKTAIETSKPTPAPDDGEGKKKGKSDPEMEAMRRQIEEMTRTLEGERKQREAAEKKTRDDSAFSELMSALDGKVRPELRDILGKSLFHLENRVGFDDNGKPVFKATRTPYAGAEPEEYSLPIAAGVAEFLKSDAAKAFLPAPSTGSGASPLPKRGPSPTPGSAPMGPPPAHATLEQKLAYAAQLEAQANAKGRK